MKFPYQWHSIFSSPLHHHFHAETHDWECITPLYLWNGVYTDLVIFRSISQRNHTLLANHKSWMRNDYPWNREWSLIQVISYLRTRLTIVWSVKMLLRRPGINLVPRVLGLFGTRFTWYWSCSLLVMCTCHHSPSFSAKDTNHVNITLTWSKIKKRCENSIIKGHKKQL